LEVKVTEFERDLVPVAAEERLERAPLALAVCQIKYETTLSVSDGHTARALQDALGGRERYGKVEQVSGIALNVSLASNASPAIQSSQGLGGWRFTSLDGEWTVSVLPDFAGIETTRYDTWSAGFGERLEQLAAAVAKVISPAFEQRLGLRYINRLSDLPIARPSDWGRYLSAELAGPLLHPVFGGAITASQQILSLSLNASADITATLRHGTVEAPEGVSYLLDIDVSRQTSREFDPQTIAMDANQFRGYAVRLFQSSLDAGYLESLR
jgi:uncharacterized protein (TIGR04255 family)